MKAKYHAQFFLEGEIHISDKRYREKQNTFYVQ